MPLEVTATAYDACEICCGNSLGITRSGTKVQARRTVAVDPKVIPLGSLIYIAHPDPHIDGLYSAEDTGGMIKNLRIDIYHKTHEEAVKFGVNKLNIYILKNQKTSVQ